MPILQRPARAIPDTVISLEQTLDLCNTLHAEHPDLRLALRLINNTEVKTRNLIRPLEEILGLTDFTARNNLYVREAKQLIPGAVEDALKNADVTPQEIDAVILVSCTGFTLPSLTAWLINLIGLPSHTRQIPIAQMGCAAGGSAVNLALDYCTAHPEANVLIVSCEFCSLCYHPTDLNIGNLLCNGLFGDAVAAAVVRGEGGQGFELERSRSHLIPNSETWISYAVESSGFHFLLDRRVASTMETVAPVVESVVKEHGWGVEDLRLFLVHAGGPRILRDLAYFLNVDQEKMRHSLATLHNHGNIASATVFDALARAFDDPEIQPGDPGILAGFGPGVTAEICVGRWTGLS
ncbi:type III polyketide synthase [Streptomyces chartreusis]|uniref:type III polyketide synthase n=1 Tax=Streptomyces chartreusis TaxID=1969 RepID=UPI0033E4899E